MPLPPEKQPLAAPQQKPVEMGGPKGNEMAQFKGALTKAMQQGNVQPQTLVQLGRLAEGAVKDKALYPMFKQAAVQSKLVDQNDFGAGIDYRMLSHFAAIAKTLGGQQ